MYYMCANREEFSFSKNKVLNVLFKDHKGSLSFT